MEKNGKLLIVGGTGFIGSAVAKEAVKRGFQVTIISKNTCPKSKQLKNTEYISVDITNKNNLMLVLKGKVFSYVINLAGYINHSSYFGGGSEVFKVHFNGTKNLVNYIEKSNLKSFIQIGSSDEYGANAAPQNESQRELPISPYSFAKVASTHFLQMLNRTQGFPVAILRLFLVYGPEQDIERFIPQIVTGCLNNEKFPLSHGEQLRDFCYIDDIVNGILKALINDNINGEIINLASGIPVSIRHVAEKVKKIAGKGELEFGKVPYRIGENMELYADTSKAKEFLEWQPLVTLSKGIFNTVARYQKTLNDE